MSEYGGRRIKQLQINEKQIKRNTKNYENIKRL